MTVIHSLTVDLVQPGIQPRLYAMQFDANTRAVAITLLCKGQSWEAPADAALGLSYRKSDGTRGFYTDGITRSANTVSVTLAPQVLTCPGTVEASLVCTDQEGHRIAAFPFEIQVAADPAAGSVASENYFPQGNAVLYIPQALTEAQQAQARANLGLEAPATAYLYNGIQLPPLPGWDKASRPYAFIREMGSLYGAIYLFFAKEIQYKQGESYYTIGVVDCESYVCYPEHEAPQWTQSLHYDDTMIGDAAKTLWANFAVRNADGSVCLPASEPVPVHNGGAAGDALLTTLDLTRYGTGETIADIIQRLILQGGGTAEVSGVGALWEDAAAPGPLAVTFPFDNSTVRTASITTMAVGDYTTQICCGAICYHPNLGVMDVSVVINISGADSATVMVFLRGRAA